MKLIIAVLAMLGSTLAIPLAMPAAAALPAAEAQRAPVNRGGGRSNGGVRKTTPDLKSSKFVSQLPPEQRGRNESL